MPRRTPNEELFKDGSKTIRFAADFGFLCALTEKFDLTKAYTAFANGDMDPKLIREIMVCALVDIDGVVIVDGSKNLCAEDLINRYGLIECSMLAGVLLSHAMIGDIKKSRLAMIEKIMSHLPSPSRAFWKVGSFLVASVVLSTVVACTIFKLNVQHGWF